MSRSYSSSSPSTWGPAKFWFHLKSRPNGYPASPPHIWKPNWDITNKLTNNPPIDWEKTKKTFRQSKTPSFWSFRLHTKPKLSPLSLPLSLGFQNALVFASQNPKISIPNCEILGFWSVPINFFFLRKDGSSSRNRRLHQRFHWSLTRAPFID